MFQLAVYNPFLWLTICKLPSSGILAAEKLRNLFPDFFFFFLSVKEDYSTSLPLNGVLRLEPDPAETESTYSQVS